MGRDGAIRFGLPSSRRIRKRREFLRIQQAGWRLSLSTCVLLVLARADNGPGRLGITVTRKFGNSVARNRAKRLIREAFRLSPGLLPNAVDLVVIPKAGAAVRNWTLTHVLDEFRRAAPLLEQRAARMRAEVAKAELAMQEVAKAELVKAELADGENSTHTPMSTGERQRP